MPPGVRLNRLLGDERGWDRFATEPGDRSGESDLDGRDDGLVRLPSSVRTLALPVSKSVIFGNSS